MQGLTYTFTVAKDDLDGQLPENVALYRLSGGSWSQLKTKHVGESGDAFRFKANSPGLSVYAIGVTEADLSVSDASLGTDAVAVGDTAAVTAQVTNDGDGSGVLTVELTADGATVETKDVRVAAGETKTVRFQYAPDALGEVDLAVNGQSAGTLTVVEEGEDPATVTTTEPEPGDEPDDDGLGAAAIAFIVLLVLAVVAGALYFARERDLI